MTGVVLLKKKRKKISYQVKLAILLGGLISFFIIAYFSIYNDNNNTKIESFVKDTVLMVEKVLTAPFDYGIDQYNQLIDLLNMYEEYQVLKAEMDDYALIYNENVALRQENNELKELLELNETITDYEILNASVIVRDFNSWNNHIYIDRGLTSGVELDMAVITNDGLIGRISEVNNFTAKVKLLTSSDFQNKISSLVKNDETTTFGVIEEYDILKNYLIFNSSQENEVLQVGNAVMTSGYGGVYPQGILIGYIDVIEQDQFGLTSIAKITPVADFNNIQTVTVIKRSNEIR